MFNQTTMKTAMSQPKNRTANRLEIRPQNSKSGNPVCKFESSQKDEAEHNRLIPWMFTEKAKLLTDSQ